MTIVFRLVRFVVIMAASVATLAGAVVVVAPHARAFVGAHDSEPVRIDLDRLSENSYVYDRYGNKMATLYSGENRAAVPLERVPETVTSSILAAEDTGFYEHKGINLKSMARAAGANLESGGVSQGGSTITQQLVKNAITGNKQDVNRKVREAVLAVELEKQMSKAEILERYMNTVYFGNGAYGVQAASQVYFSKDVEALNWAEGALLAAIIRSPNQYDPVKNPDIAFERRKLVLKRLHETERLDQLEADGANFVPLPTRLNLPSRPNDYFVNLVTRQLERDPRVGEKKLFGGGLHIYTTFDPVAQEQAKAARNATMPGAKPDGTFDLPPHPQTGAARYGTAAIASVEPSTGAVRVLVGGPEYTDARQGGKVDLATQGEGFLAGSSYKTFVLAAAFELGLTPEDTIDGSGPCDGIPGYEKEDFIPDNYEAGSGGVATLRTQTQKSSNCAFLRLGAIIGIDKVAETATKLGLTTDVSEVNASAPIGTDRVYPLDMASAYATLANDGVRNRPYFFDRVEDRDGNVIVRHQAQGERAVSVQTARRVTEVLESNVETGTGTRAQLATGQPSAGKTGTTNNSYHIWFVGYTPHLATAVWMGSPNGDVSIGFGGAATGGRYPADTFGRMYDAVLAKTPIWKFTPPEPVLDSRYLRLPRPGSPFGSDGFPFAGIGAPPANGAGTPPPAGPGTPAPEIGAPFGGQPPTTRP